LRQFEDTKRAFRGYCA